LLDLLDELLLDAARDGSDAAPRIRDDTAS
jgi:hypothetical protein